MYLGLGPCPWGTARELFDGQVATAAPGQRVNLHPYRCFRSLVLARSDDTDAHGDLRRAAPTGRIGPIANL